MSFPTEAESLFKEIVRSVMDAPDPIDAVRAAAGRGAADSLSPSPLRSAVEKRTLIDEIFKAHGKVKSYWMQEDGVSIDQVPFVFMLNNIRGLLDDNYLYPAVREFLPDGDALVERFLVDDHEVHRGHFELIALRQDGELASFLERTRTLAPLVLENIRAHEEEMVLPLHDAAPAERLVALGAEAREELADFYLWF
ncbi:MULTISPECIES: hypothetical protein [unclassified Streptomyces]|uniref:hypothetical protein n=1 Tax=unclassified Streptomyces TaxID=2593676 RepID=UPI0029660300|nr:hypothetical protein [Streptomyces sp. SJL17-1]